MALWQSRNEGEKVCGGYFVLAGTVTQAALFQITCSPLMGALKSVGVCEAERRPWLKPGLGGCIGG